MEELVKKYHKTQFRNDNKIPYIEHLIGVRSVLESTLQMTGECKDQEEMTTLLNAALGHDLIEDTEVSQEEIMERGGPVVLELIKRLSNPVDDYHLDEYMEQLRSSKEDVRLVKYADLVENTFSVCYGLHDLGVDWFYDFYEPILKASTATLADSEFVQYKKSADLLRSMLSVATRLVYDKLPIMKGDVQK